MLVRVFESLLGVVAANVDFLCASTSIAAQAALDSADSAALWRPLAAPLPAPFLQVLAAKAPRALESLRRILQAGTAAAPQCAPKARDLLRADLDAAADLLCALCRTKEGARDGSIAALDAPALTRQLFVAQSSLSAARLLATVSSLSGAHADLLAADAALLPLLAGLVADWSQGEDDWRRLCVCALHNLLRACPDALYPPLLPARSDDRSRLAAAAASCARRMRPLTRRS